MARALALAWGRHPTRNASAAAQPLTRSGNLFILRAVLVSCSAAPVIDQEFLEHKRGESTGFKSLFLRAVQQFPKLFKVVTTDAGMTAAANAQLVGDHDRYYLFGLKGNQRALFPLAQQLLQGRPEVARTDEREQGYQVSRVLRVVACPASVEFPFAKYFWSVTKTKQRGAELTEEVRYFVTSVPAELMDDDERLGLVRMHWRIENGSNWTNDVIFKEDTRVLCSKGDGPLVQSWVTVLAQNLVGMVRHSLPGKRQASGRLGGNPKYRLPGLPDVEREDRRACSLSCLRACQPSPPHFIDSATESTGRPGWHGFASRSVWVGRLSGPGLAILGPINPAPLGEGARGTRRMRPGRGLGSTG